MFKIEIKNQKVDDVEASGNIPLLKSLEQAGLSLPVGCRYGGCISCAGRLISGEVRQTAAVALNKRQLKEGYILLCVAKPLTDCVLEVGVQSHDRLYLNPFKHPGDLKKIPECLKEKESSE